MKRKHKRPKEKMNAGSPREENAGIEGIFAIDTHCNNK